MELPEYTGKTGTRNANYANIYIYLHIYISEISIDMNRECARFACSIISSPMHYLWVLVVGMTDTGGSIFRFTCSI